MLLRRADTEHVPGVPKRGFTLHPTDLAKNKQERKISQLLEIIQFAHGRNNKILTRTILISLAKATSFASCSLSQKTKTSIVFKINLSQF